MGHAKRREQDRTVDRVGVDRDKAGLDDGTVDRILDLRLGAQDGDPVAGIRNALLASAAFWAALAVAFLYL